MAQYIPFSQENISRVRGLNEALQWDNARIGKLALSLGLRYFSHDQVRGLPPPRTSDTYLMDTQIDPEQNQLRTFKLLIESREGRRLDQSEANEWFTKYLDLGITKLHEAWLGRDQDKYKLYAFLRDLLATTPQSDPLTALVGSAPEVLIGSDANDRPLRFRPNVEGGYRNAPHLAVVGASGVGKTQCALALLDQTLSQSPNTGCLILDYKGDISRQQKSFLESHGFEIYAAGQRALPLNPLFLPPDANSAMTAQALAERLTEIQHLGPVQTLLIREAAQAVFSDRELFQPTLKGFKDALNALYEQKGKGNKADTAIKLISDLADFDLFQGESGLDPATFLSKRIIIDFAATESFRDLVAFFLLNYLSNGMRLLGDAPVNQSSDGTRTRDLRSIVFIDEAHHYLRADASPVYQIVREARSFGVALWLSTQTLADFKSDNDDLTTNLSTWLLFSPGGNIPTAGKLAGLLRITPADAATITSTLPTLGNAECYANIDGHPKRIKAVQLYDKANWPTGG